VKNVKVLTDKYLLRVKNIKSVFIFMYFISEFNDRYPINKHILHAEDSHLARGAQQKKNNDERSIFHLQ
jgi:hypothetical protein